LLLEKPVLLGRGGNFSNAIGPKGAPTLALGSTQPLTEMSKRNAFWVVKAAGVLGLTNLSPSRANCQDIWEPQPSGTVSASLGLYRDCVTLALSKTKSSLPCSQMLIQKKNTLL